MSKHGAKLILLLLTSEICLSLHRRCLSSSNSFVTPKRKIKHDTLPVIELRWLRSQDMTNVLGLYREKLLYGGVQ